MGTTPRQQASPQSAYAGLDFIKAAFCPLEFTATKLGKHPEFTQLRKDKALAPLNLKPTTWAVPPVFVAPPSHKASKIWLLRAMYAPT